MKTSTRLNRKTTLTSAAPVLFLMLGNTQCWCSEVIDQQYDSAISFKSFNTELYRSQSFTVGISGQLSRIEVKLAGHGSSRFEIWDTTGSAPVPVPGNALASGVITFNTGSNNSAAYYSLNILSDNLMVTAGDVLAIVQIGSSHTGYGSWWGKVYGDYAGGSYYTTTTSNPIRPWTSTNQDANFKTYIIPIPEPTTLSLATLALIPVVIRRR